MIHTAASLSALKLSDIKVIASELSIVPVGNKSKRETFITAILEFQSAQVIVQTPAIESQPIIVQSTFEDEPQPIANLKPIQPQSSVIVALIAILAVVTAVRAVVLVGTVGINLTVRGATHAIGMYRRWSTVKLPQPQPELIPVLA